VDIQTFPWDWIARDSSFLPDASKPVFELKKMYDASTRSIFLVKSGMSLVPPLDLRRLCKVVHFVGESKQDTRDCGSKGTLEKDTIPAALQRERVALLGHTLKGRARTKTGDLIIYLRF
jgi:hypothetical protein